MSWIPSTVDRWLGHWASAAPDRLAIECEGEAIGYAALAARVSLAASGLESLGLGRGDKIALWAPNSTDWVVIQYAAARIGAILVPVNTRHRLQELEYTLRQSDSRIFILADRFGEADFLGMFRSLCPEADRAEDGPLRSARFPELRHAVLLGCRPHPGLPSFSDIIDRGEGRSLKGASHPDDVVLIQYTSGTTGFPKGVMLRQDAMLRNAWCMSGRMGIDKRDRIFSPLPFIHVGGTVLSILVALVRGAALITVGHFDLGRALALIRERRPTAMTGIETHYLKIYQHPGFDPADTHSITKGWAIGPPEIIRQIIERMGVRDLLNVYGISEASPNVTTTLPGDSLEQRLQTVGVTHEGLEVAISDLETGAPLGPGEEGEVCVRGWSVMAGYYKKPDETAKAIDGGGWLHTGDSGRLDAEGRLAFTGRIKDLIRVGGENVSAIEIENFLLTHPAVKQAYAVAVPDPELTEVGVAFVEPVEGRSVTEAELQDFMRGKLASFKIPRRILFRKEFPMTGSGKVQKFKLREIAIGAEGG